ncbi:antitoxin [Catellatospora sp. KI3]|uniref:antitoxin n=1 Tax=Catellatospora sp. KI3 TaxID=3041620 RepID=UPI002482A60C|nr:antitoxin [Catellatospora sp. KI3]MDI1461754.1 antitoxin [Catellatospora sp. KI3]
MGIMDKAKDALGITDDKVDQLGDKAKGAVDSAGDKVDDATGGKFKDQVDKGQDTAKDAIDKMTS